MNRQKTYLVTGGAGFIGSHLCARLLADGHRVICLDNLQTGARDNVAAMEDEPGFSFIEHDIVLPLPADLRPDVILNLACAASPVRYQADPVHTMKTSVIGALNVLELARASNAVVLQASTSEVYGDPEMHPQPETYCGNVNPIGPRACYDEGKRAAETLFFDFARRHGLRIKVARIFNTYGPRMDPEDGRIVSNFITQALRGLPLTVYGQGQQTRSFCFVSDMVEGLLALAHSPDEVQGPVNLGNPDEQRVIDIAHLVLELTGSSSRITFEDLPEDDPKRRRPVIERADELLGWQPKVRLREGLLQTVDAFAKAEAAQALPASPALAGAASLALQEG